MSVALWKGSEAMAVSGSSDGTIKLWDLQHGKLLTTCEGHLRDVWSVTVTEGKRPLIVSASVDRTMRSWDISRFLLDLKWSRRRALCVFLKGSGFVVADVKAPSSQAPAPAPVPVPEAALAAAAAASSGARAVEGGLGSTAEGTDATDGDGDAAASSLLSQHQSLQQSDTAAAQPALTPIVPTINAAPSPHTQDFRASRTVFQTTFLCSEIASFL